jgi:hypothetical protein
MTTQDIRWIQRFNHFNKAFSQLKEGIVSAIIHTYFAEFEAFEVRLEKMKADEKS